MSKNNYRLIKERKSGKFEVWNLDADTNKGRIEDEFFTLQDAVRFADKMESDIDEYSEYHVLFQLQPPRQPRKKRPVFYAINEFIKGKDAIR